jgi:lipopolysaccharide/colanic/teichoic acid biosynthesis glycosyltransferase
MFSKRCLDLVLVTVTAPIWVPLLALVALLVRVKLGSPVLFRQERAGRAGRPFFVIKFRSMRDLRAAGGTLLPDEARLTGFGQWLRSTSLDEIPQLWNVVRGDMSLVGPRPLLMRYLPRYSAEQARRNEMPPGMTGWCQVNGRNALSWDEKFNFDTWYVAHWSLWLDIRILFLTIGQVLVRRGVSPADQVTMPEFKPDKPKS